MCHFADTESQDQQTEEWTEAAPARRRL